MLLLGSSIVWFTLAEIFHSEQVENFESNNLRLNVRFVNTWDILVSLVLLEAGFMRSSLLSVSFGLHDDSVIADSRAACFSLICSSISDTRFWVLTSVSD
jgi:hypothetical protein